MKRVEMIVQCQAHTVHVAESAPLSHVVARALHETQNVTRDPSEWQLRNVDGVLIPQAFTVLDVDTTQPFYLNPPAGVGG
jgi:hypothetical protein